MGGELPEGKARGRIKGESGYFFFQNRKDGNAVGIKSRLADRCLGQLLGRPLEGDLGEGVSEDPVGFRKKLGSDGVGGGKILAHADGLGSLTGEEECGFHGVLKVKRDSGFGESLFLIVEIPFSKTVEAPRFPECG